MTDLVLDPIDPPEAPPDIWQAARDIYLAGQPGRVVCAALGLKESTFWRRAALGGWLRRDGDAPAPPPLDLTAPPDTTEGALDKAWRRVCAAVDAGLSAEALRWMRVHAALKAQHSDGFLTAMRDRRDGHEHVEQLVRAMTHELKSPLAAIGGAAELLQDELPAADRQLFAQQIRDQADRLHVLVERLLELSKLEHRHSLDQQVVLDLGLCADQALKAAAPRLEQRQLTLVWHPLDSLAHVKGEPDLLAMAISNLLENAIDFSSPGGRVEVTLTRVHAGVELSVRDHGPGVPDYALGRLGERFYSTPRPAGPGETPRKGSGLGLAIVRQVMQLHGGHLRLQAAEPGFRATLHLPAATSR